MLIFSPFHDNLEDKATIRELNFCNAVNDSRNGLKCMRPGCKGINTEVVVNSGTPDTFKFELKGFCCEDFKARVNKIIIL